MLLIQKHLLVYDKPIHPVDPGRIDSKCYWLADEASAPPLSLPQNTGDIPLIPCQCLGNSVENR